MKLSQMRLYQKNKLSATPQVLTQAPVNGEWITTLTDCDMFYGVQYNKSDAQRYFSQTYAADVTDVFATETDTGLTNDDSLKIDDVTYSVDSNVDVMKTGEIFLIGLKVHE